jgi:hypothetical protein
MANPKLLKADFEREREKVRLAITSKKLKYYGVLVLSAHPEIKPKDIYNVIHGGNQKWEVLSAIGEVVGVEVNVPEKEKVA